MMVYTKSPRAKSFRACKSPLDAAYFIRSLGARFINVRNAHGRYIVNYFVRNA